METALRFNRQWSEQLDKRLRIIVIAVLLTLFSMGIVNIVYAYDFSGGYLSTKTIGGSGMGDSILTISAIGSGLSSLDLGMVGERAAPGSVSANVGTQLLKSVLPIVIACVIVIAVVRDLSSQSIFIGTIVGLIAFVIVTELLNILL